MHSRGTANRKRAAEHAHLPERVASRLLGAAVKPVLCFVVELEQELRPQREAAATQDIDGAAGLAGEQPPDTAATAAEGASQQTQAPERKFKASHAIEPRTLQLTPLARLRHRLGPEAHPSGARKERGGHGCAAAQHNGRTPTRRESR